MIKSAVKYTPGAVVPEAITFGLYDIHYDPNAVSLNGGRVRPLETIIEEVSHTVQFLQIWAGLRQDAYLLNNHGEDSSDYNHAMSVWSNNYSYYAIKAVVKLRAPYDNDVENWAKGNVKSIITGLRQGDRAQICGYDLYPRRK